MVCFKRRYPGSSGQTVSQSARRFRIQDSAERNDTTFKYECNRRTNQDVLVHEKREELTTEGGLDVVAQESKIAETCQRLAVAGIEVSLFIDADDQQIEAAKRINVPVIELHTGHYANAKTLGEQERELQRIQKAAAFAQAQGLVVNAGHGLHYDNVQAIAAIPMINELNIGHSIIAQAMFDGIENAVRQMKALMQSAAPPWH